MLSIEARPHIIRIHSHRKWFYALVSFVIPNPSFNNDRTAFNAANCYGKFGKQHLLKLSATMPTTSHLQVRGFWSRVRKGLHAALYQQSVVSHGYHNDAKRHWVSCFNLTNIYIYICNSFWRRVEGHQNRKLALLAVFLNRLLEERGMAATEPNPDKVSY